MSGSKMEKHIARYYLLEGGRLQVKEKEVYTTNICLIDIPFDCLFVEIISVDGEVREGLLKDNQRIEKYLIGKRFDRWRSSFKDEMQKFNFVMQKVYQPHIELDERKIKNGRYTIASEDQSEA